MLNPEFTFSPTWWRLSRLGKEPNLIRIAALDFFCDYAANEGKMSVNEALTILGEPVLEALIGNETLVVDGENIRIPYLDSQKKTKIEQIRFIIDNNKDIENYITIRGRDKIDRDDRGGMGEKEGKERKERETTLEGRKRRGSIYDHDQMLQMFEGFWEYYDKKVGKDKAMMRGSEEAAEAGVVGSAIRSRSGFRHLPASCLHFRNTLPAYLEAHHEKKYRKDPVRYLSHKAFNDEPVNASERHSQFNQSKTNESTPIRVYAPEPGIVR